METNTVMQLADNSAVDQVAEPPAIPRCARTRRVEVKVKDQRST
jgi:hypothetical protein